MKIIKQGVLPQNKLWRGTCIRCGTVAEATQAEVNVTHEPGGGTYAEAQCPFCKQTMFFYELTNDTNSR